MGLLHEKAFTMWSVKVPSSLNGKRLLGHEQTCRLVTGWGRVQFFACDFHANFVGPKRLQTFLLAF